MESTNGNDFLPRYAGTWRELYLPAQGMMAVWNSGRYSQLVIPSYTIIFIWAFGHQKLKSFQANYMDAWKCVSTLRGDGQAAAPESLPASLGKQGFTKLPMSSHQANWHWTKLFQGSKEIWRNLIVQRHVCLNITTAWLGLKFPFLVLLKPLQYCIDVAKCKKFSDADSEVVRELLWCKCTKSRRFFQKFLLKMSDKPDRSMRPDDHRRKWDHVEYEKNAQARLELEEAIEKSRERKDK